MYKGVLAQCPVPLSSSLSTSITPYSNIMARTRQTARKCTGGTAPRRPGFGEAPNNATPPVAPPVAPAPGDLNGTPTDEVSPGFFFSSNVF